MGIKLFIGGYPLEMDEMGLAQLIAPHGDIVEMKLVRDKKTRKAKGYAFVVMASENDAIAVISALDGTKTSNRRLIVSLAPVLDK
ncbi:RNA-binding protein [Mucilaginibacter corticis]|uniref:RNA-binding protein n=1 Tax=Mucilaginibacter corticis TaxID=2597670 RepID=A0A556M905_9SPHI|nr:RNA-binding protein [Mucilaginibacter corticis]TSJ36407.1 RNA-binding protein [Mucilaginibacter corticis]